MAIERSHAYKLGKAACENDTAISYTHDAQLMAMIKNNPHKKFELINDFDLGWKTQAKIMQPKD